jgi:protein transport protein SEC24
VLLYNKNLIFYPNLDSDQSYSISLGLKTDEEGKNSTRIEDDFTYIQASLIYSKGDGNKRIRVFNLCIPVSSNPKTIYESVNSEILSSFLTQYLIMKIFKSKNLVESVAELEKQFFQLNDAYFSNLNLIKKELDGEMRTVSLYFLGMLKNCLFNRNERGVNNDIDLSNYYRARLQKTKMEDIICFVYPRIYILDNILELQGDEYPPIANDSKESLDSQGSIFLIDNGFELILYLRNYVDKNIIHNLFGVDNFNEINLENATESNVFDYDENKNEFKKKIMDIIDNIRGIKSLLQNLRFVFEGINEGNIINDILIEDNNNKGYPFNFEKFYNKIIFDSVKY